MTVRDGLTGVNRVIGLVRHRGSAPRSITAHLTDEHDTWLVEHAFIATLEMTSLLVRQLERLPCVLSVEH